MIPMMGGGTSLQQTTSSEAKSGVGAASGTFGSGPTGAGGAGGRGFVNNFAAERASLEARPEINGPATASLPAWIVPAAIGAATLVLVLVLRSKH